MANYLTFASAEPFTIAVNNATKNWDGILEYSTDAASWTEWDGTTVITSADHGGEQRIYMRGRGNTNISGSGYSSNSDKCWVSTGNDIRCIGNIENLLDCETVANGAHPPMGDACFCGLFYGWTSLITPPELPATVLEFECYRMMFYGCTGLTTAPELPATELAVGCYTEMFRGCTGLTVAPKLPAESVPTACYEAMFYECAGLIEAPELPAKTLGGNCYMEMFYGCTSLTRAPTLPATTLDSWCYGGMFSGCGSLTAIPSLPATVLPHNCYNGMFAGCDGVKISKTQSDEYPNEYRIPTSGDGTADIWALLNTFNKTGGTFTGSPSINTTYYTANEVVYPAAPAEPFRPDPFSVTLGWLAGSRIAGQRGKGHSAE